MKSKIGIILLLLIIGTISTVFAQSEAAEDSLLKQGLKWKSAPLYVRAMPFSIYTGAGLVKDRTAQYLEIGKSFNIIDVGVGFGRSAFRPDTTLFVEGKVTMDVGNIGIFANEMTIGAGKLFDSRGSLMLELTYNIFMQVSKNWGVGITTGYYDFSNQVYGSSKSFFGVMLRYGLQRTDSGGLLTMRRPPRPRKAAKPKHIHK